MRNPVGLAIIIIGFSAVAAEFALLGGIGPLGADILWPACILFLTLWVCLVVFAFIRQGRSTWKPFLVTGPLLLCTTAASWVLYTCFARGSCPF